MKKLVIMALLAVLFVGSAQAAIVYSEDWEGAAAYPTITEDVAFGYVKGQPGSSVPVDAGPLLGTNVAHLPSPGIALSVKTLPGLADDLITFQYDGYITTWLAQMAKSGSIFLIERHRPR